jgi:tetratricopeptide (TPR) repeat protein
MMYRNWILKIFCFGLIGLTAAGAPAQKKTVVSPTGQTRTITVVSEPNSVVWINDIRYGTTDDDGRLTIKNLAGGVKQMRLRADGFKETTQNLTAAQKGEIKIALTKTTDEAELTFQQAESYAVTDREKAVEMYKKAVVLRPKYMDAQLGLARALSASGDNEGALKAVREARKWRPGYAEISAIEGRIHAAAGEEEEAVAAFKRAVTEGKGFQPEAHAGLANLYREKAEGLSAEGDFESEKQYYLMAAGELKKAVQQLGGAPDAIVIYQLLGDSYERAKMYKEAIGVYQDFLRVFPDANEAVTVRSFITQLEKQMAEQE